MIESHCWGLSVCFHILQVYPPLMARRVHPDKEIRKVIKVLTRAGWVVEVSKGRSSHAWGRAHCPHGHPECAASIWSTPASPDTHAARLLAKIGACLRRSQAT